MYFYLSTFLFLVHSFIFSMQLSSASHDKSKLCITQVTTNENTGEKIYVGTYPLERDKGLIRLESRQFMKDLLCPAALCPDNLKGINLIINRHRENIVIIKALLNKTVAELYQDKDAMRVWTPWWDNTIREMQDYSKAERNDRIRGGNRLLIDFRSPCSYHVVVPHDADLEVNFEYGDITYKSAEPTMLDVNSSTVNVWGDSGHNGRPQHWTYYWGSYSDSYSKLITKQGHTIVLKEN